MGSPEQVNELDEILTSLDKPHEFHRYDDAGHAFFSVDRGPTALRPPTTAGRRLCVAFFATHLGG